MAMVRGVNWSDYSMGKTGNGTNVIGQQWWPDILSYAIENNILLRYVFPVSEAFGAKKGDRVNVNVRGDITNLGTAALADGTRTTTGSFVTTKTQVIISEFGNSIPWGRKWDEFLAIPSVQRSVMETLRDDFTMSLAYNLAGAFIAGSGTKFATEAAGSWTGTTNTSARGGSALLDGTGVRLVRDYLRRANAPFPEPNYYVMIGHTDTFRGIKNDPDYISYLSALAPAGDTRLLTGVAGAMDGVLFLENNYFTKGTSVVFGGAPIAWGVADPLKISVDPDHENDFGRSIAAAWFSMWGSAAVLPTYLACVMTTP
jgi:N4-gp56 family major capsid protein